VKFPCAQVHHDDGMSPTSVARPQFANDAVNVTECPIANNEGDLDGLFWYVASCSLVDIHPGDGGSKRL
jgi:hypothetical protein